MKRPLRKQRVIMRQRHREEMKHLVQRAILRTAMLTLVVGFVLGLATRGEWVLTHLSLRPAPQVDVRAQGSLEGLPFLREIPIQRSWLWVPGVAGHVSRKLLQKYPEIRAVTFEKYFFQNRMVLRAAPRVPVARWKGQAIDREGVLFGIPAVASLTVPEIATFMDDLSPLERQWVGALSQSAGFWSRVKKIQRDLQGDMRIESDTGTHIVWGRPDLATMMRKAQYMSRVLDDAHERLGGAASADLRFFEQGRIVVRPKGV